MTPSAVAEHDTSWSGAWHTALIDLELEVERAEALLRSAEPSAPEISAWAPPPGLGPLPAGLLDRARALHSRQLRVSQTIVDALTHNRAQAAMAARLESGQTATRPVYVDRAC